jgi:hypothetical protein
LQASPSGARPINLEHRLQAAVGDQYRILRELGSGAGASGDLLYYVMPFISGESLLALKAADRYRRFVDLWKDADPELQPGVREVRAHRARLACLSTESPS